MEARFLLSMVVVCWTFRKFCSIVLRMNRKLTFLGSNTTKLPMTELIVALFFELTLAQISSGLKTGCPVLNPNSSHLFLEATSKPLKNSFPNSEFLDIDDGLGLVIVQRLASLELSTFMIAGDMAMSSLSVAR